jgi:iron-sulfur cluster assembly protein
MVTITETAKTKLIDLMKEGELDDSYFLRVGVKGGG